MMHRTLLLTMVIATTLSAHASAQSLTVLPDGTTVSDITPDGSIVVGSGPGGGFFWDWKNDPAPTYFTGGYNIVAVSDDGQTLAGNMQEPGGSDQVAAIWTQAGGWISLDSLPNAACTSLSRATDISGDGSVVVGLSWDGCSARGFRWTAATGMQELLHLGANANNANAISGDGSIIGGYGNGSANNRSPATWESDLSGAMFDAADYGEVYGFNADGSLTVGTKYYTGNNWFSAYYSVNGGSPIELGALHPGNMAGRAVAVSLNMELIVGYDLAGLGTEAWVWTPLSGILGLNDLLPALGITGAPFMLQCSAVSDDGTVVVGTAEGSAGFPSSAGFIVEFELSQGWDDLGNALSGTLGEPSLTGSGDLQPFANVSISLNNALPGGSAWLLIGLSSLNAPFKGGVLVPNPDMILGPLGLDGAGALDLSTFWPVGVPSGFTTYLQYWIPDAAGTKGYAASNGLGATTP